VKLERLGRKDAPELMQFYNTVFSYPPENGFHVQLPAMWRDTDECIGKNIAIRDNGRIVAAMGIYPLRVRVGSHELLFATTGNVGVAADYRKRGLMQELMAGTHEELIRIGADAARLGGKRQRYQLHGYDYIGKNLNYTLTPENVRRTEAPYGCSFTPIDRNNAKAIAYLRTLHQQKTVYVERAPEDFYDVMAAWHNQPYLATDASGKWVGGLTVSPDEQTVSEYYAETPESAYEILCSWVMSRDLPRIQLVADPTDHVFNRLIGRSAAQISEGYPTMVRVLHWDTFTNAYLAVREPMGLTDTFVLGIRDYGNIEIGERACAKTAKEADLQMDCLDATRFLFGYQGPENVCALPPKKSALIRQMLPIPFWWNGQDRV